MSWTCASTCAAAASLRNKLCRLKSMCNLSVACLSFLLWWVYFGHCRRKCVTVSRDRHSLHWQSRWRSIRWRWKFRLLCPVFRRKSLGESHERGPQVPFSVVWKTVYIGLLWDCLCIYHFKLQNRMSWLRHTCPGDWEKGLTVSDVFLMEWI